MSEAINHNQRATGRVVEVGMSDETKGNFVRIERIGEPTEPGTNELIIDGLTKAEAREFGKHFMVSITVTWGDGK